MLWWIVITVRHHLKRMQQSQPLWKTNSIWGTSVLGKRRGLWARVSATSSNSNHSQLQRVSPQQCSSLSQEEYHYLICNKRYQLLETNSKVCNRPVIVRNRCKSCEESRLHETIKRSLFKCSPINLLRISRKRSSLHQKNLWLMMITALCSLVYKVLRRNRLSGITRVRKRWWRRKVRVINWRSHRKSKLRSVSRSDRQTSHPWQNLAIKRQLRTRWTLRLLRRANLWISSSQCSQLKFQPQRGIARLKNRNQRYPPLRIKLRR